MKVVLDRQPLLGTAPLPDWLRNLARRRAGPLVALDTYKDNLCLWRCIAVHRGAQPDRSTQAAQELVKSFFKLETVPNEWPKTSLDELDKVERHLNQGRPLSDCFGIRVYEPEREDGREVIWHLRRNRTDVLKDVLTIGIYEGHAFVIKNIKSLAKTHACVHCRARFTQPHSLQRGMPKGVPKARLLSIAQTSESKLHRQSTRKPSTLRITGFTRISSVVGTRN